MNSYVTVDLLKSSSVLDITGSGDDARLRGVLENVSRQIDRYCNRHFYAASLTKKFDGSGTQRLLVPDLISIDSSGLKTDDNKDRMFESTWATTDYLLLPSNADPTTAGNPQSRPYTVAEVDTDAGTKADWPAGRQTVQIAGQWGWWRHLKRASETATVANSTTTTLTASAATDVEVGHSLLLESEQVYVTAISGTTYTITRGVNGTTAASHSGGTAIDIYEYPGPIIEAVIIQAARLWRRKDATFASPVGFPETGPDEGVGRTRPRREALAGAVPKGGAGGRRLMADEIKDAKDGLSTLLSNISGLKVIDYPAEAVHEFPVAVVLFESRDAAQTLGGSSFAGKIKVVLLVSSADTQQAYDTLDQYMAPLGTSSIEAAVDADNTWGSKVDDGRLVSVDDVGHRKLWGGFYVGADFHFEFVKSVSG